MSIDRRGNISELYNELHNTVSEERYLVGITDHELQRRMGVIESMVNNTEQFPILAREELRYLESKFTVLKDPLYQELLFWIGESDFNVLDIFQSDGDINRTMRVVKRQQIFNYYLGNNKGPAYSYKVN